MSEASLRRSLVVFLAFFGFYLALMPPALAPYRDAGEMAASAWTLGVSHPTSYPLYILLGRLFEALPIANPAYRLNLLSVLSSAFALAALFGFCEKFYGFWAGIGAVFLLGFNETFWSLALVQEMYALGFAFAVVLTGLALELGERWRERLWLFFVFIFALALTNRLDLLLVAPGLLWLALGYWKKDRAASWASWAFLVFPAAIFISNANALVVLLLLATALWAYEGPDKSRWALRSFLIGLLGLSAYLYLPIRSAGRPWLDWNHPANLANFAGSLTRSHYGGTLDLLSTKYAKGELFGVNLLVYWRHLWRNFSLPGLGLVVLGSWASFRNNRRRWTGIAALFWWTGPFFLLLANMPPNPHAASIVEPNYVMPDLFLILWAAEGIALLAQFRGEGRGVRGEQTNSPASTDDVHIFSDRSRSLAPHPSPLSPVAVVLALSLAVIPLVQGRVAAQNRRFHFYTYDYARNVFLSAPQGAVVVAKKDVQIFSLWYYQTVQGWRPDLRLVAQGLSGSAWYQEGWHRRDPSLTLFYLEGEPDLWNQFVSANGTVAATYDADVPDFLDAKAQPRGLLRVFNARGEGRGVRGEANESRLLTPYPSPLAPSLWPSIVRRGLYLYEEEPDFFTSDLVDSYSQARSREGAALQAAKLRTAAREAFLSAWAMHWLFPAPVNFLGFMDYEDGRMKEAMNDYALAGLMLEKLSGLAAEYRALPGAQEDIKRGLAENLTQRGVLCEKSGDRAGAERYYRDSIAAYPTSQAHYDWAVLYWKKDPAVAERELKEALRLDPKNAQAAGYLSMLEAGRAYRGK